MSSSVCAVCQAVLNLSRREVQEITIEVKKVARDRYFVPDDEVHKIIHRIHTAHDKQKNIVGNQLAHNDSPASDAQKHS